MNIYKKMTIQSLKTELELTQREYASIEYKLRSICREIFEREQTERENKKHNFKINDKVRTPYGVGTVIKVNELFIYVEHTHNKDGLKKRRKGTVKFSNIPYQNREFSISSVEKLPN